MICITEMNFVGCMIAFVLIGFIINEIRHIIKIAKQEKNDE